jgi:hypothetical protein
VPQLPPLLRRPAQKQLPQRACRRAIIIIIAIIAVVVCCCSSH